MFRKHSSEIISWAAGRKMMTEENYARWYVIQSTTFRVRLILSDNELQGFRKIWLYLSFCEGPLRYGCGLTYHTCFVCVCETMYWWWDRPNTSLTLVGYHTFSCGPTAWPSSFKTPRPRGEHPKVSALSLLSVEQSGNRCTEVKTLSFNFFIASTWFCLFCFVCFSCTER